MSKPLREKMPSVAAFIDDMRSAFGADVVNSAIRAGIDGQPTFWASEGGHQIGTRAPHDAERAVKLSDTHVGPINAPAAQHASRRGNK